VDPPHYVNDQGMSSLDVGEGPYLLRWQTSPVLKTSYVNANLLQKEFSAKHLLACISTQSVILSGMAFGPAGSTASEDRTTAFFATLQSIKEGTKVDYLGDPMTELNIPVFDSFNSASRKPVAVLKSVIHWKAYLRFILPSNVRGITVVLQNRCDGSHTFEIDGKEANVVGFGDLHDPKFDQYERVGSFNIDNLDDGTVSGIPFNQDGCPYSFHVYPTQRFHDDFVNIQPIAVTSSVALVFAFTILMFFCYDWLVERRQRLILAKAAQSTALVSVSTLLS
jgi:hypothetical protein